MARNLAEEPDFCEQAATLLKAVGHPLRLRIVALLCQGPLHVTALAERLEVKQPVVSQQLGILRLHGAVSATRLDGFALYELAETRLRKLVDCMETCPEDQRSDARDPGA